MPSRDLYASRPQGSNTRHPRRRVKMRRRFVLAGAIVALAVAGAAVFASTASGTGAKRTRQQKTINVAVFLASAANTYWEAALLGAKDVAKKNPNVKLTVFDGKFNTNTQLSQLRDALVSKKYQAWFVGPNDGGPLTPTIKQAITQGVKVGCALVPCGPNIRDVHVQIPGQVIFAGLGFYPNGQQLGRLVVQGCSGISDCQVLWLPGLPTLPLAGAHKAEQLAGKSGIKMYGNGCTFEAKQLILQGKQTGCSVYLPRTEGRLVVQAIVNAVNGSKKTGIYVNPLKYSPIGGLGTKANIAKFKPEFHS